VPEHCSQFSAGNPADVQTRHAPEPLHSVHSGASIPQCTQLIEADGTRPWQLGQAKSDIEKVPEKSASGSGWGRDSISSIQTAAERVKR
jgi:hypothetical protein